jgi:ferritin
MGSYLKKMGLDNIGDFFYVDQVKEEQSHAQLISDYINDRNEIVLSLPVPDGNLEISNLNNFSDLYLDREQVTTAKLSVIAQQALTEGDFMLFDFMQEMIRKQRNEENEALTFRDRAYMADNDLKTWLIWDANYDD